MSSKKQVETFVNSTYIIDSFNNIKEESKKINLVEIISARKIVTVFYLSNVYIYFLSFIFEFCFSSLLHIDLHLLRLQIKSINIAFPKREKSNEC